MQVGLSIPVRVARWAVESREGESGALRRCCGRSLSSGMLRVTSPPGLAGTGDTRDVGGGGDVRLLDAAGQGRA